ncbi:MAG: Rv3654c family TadE-like protein [Microbacterium gubbeenense]|uniref:Rv3654c family TadE-like protein n=2 Tax=Microbacterium gubbeenense TaxID=159896 RepID=UPI003F9B8E87
MGASILTAGAIGCAATLAMGLAVVGGASVASQRAAGIADAAALAAADALAGFATGDPCGRAAQVVSAQGASVTSCNIDGLTATVRISMTYARFPVAAAARAGPPPEAESP